MRFMVLVKSDERCEAGVLPDEQALSDMGAFNEQLIQAGVMLAGEGLQASSKGARVRFSGTKTRVIDGPFAEAKELVAGYWLLQAESQQEVIEWLKRAPFQDGEVEIRPLFEIEDIPRDPAEQPDGWRAKEERQRETLSQPFRTLNPRKPGTARYMSLIKADANTEAGAVPSEQLLSEMGALMEQMIRAGVALSGDGLQPSSAGTRIVYTAGKPRIVDGPFTESKELIAGYCLLQTATKEEAVDWARRCLKIHVRGTGVEQAEIELRQVFELEDFPVSSDEKPNGWRAQEQAFRDATSA